GFEAAPQPLGVDDAGREVLTFIEGDTVMTPIPARVWFDSMTDAAVLLRRFHDLSVGFRYHADAVWRAQPADPGLPEVICHSDWAHYNGVWRSGRLIAMIDWDFARSGSRHY